MVEIGLGDVTIVKITKNFGKNIKLKHSQLFVIFNKIAQSDPHNILIH